jgi:hypothetical protein
MQVFFVFEKGGGVCDFAVIFVIFGGIFVLGGDFSVIRKNSASHIFRGG